MTNAHRGNDKKESVPVKGSHLITRTVKSPEAKTIGAQFELEVLPLGLEETGTCGRLPPIQMLCVHINRIAYRAFYEHPVTNTYDPSFLPVGTTDEFLSKNPCSLDVRRRSYPQTVFVPA